MLVGAFGVTAALEADLAWRLRAALEEQDAEVFLRPGLALAASCATQAGERRGMLCALEGRLFEEAHLASELGLENPDTLELLAAAVGAWDRAAPTRLRGEFTALTWDAESGRGLVFQDHFGLKALYLAATGSHLSFATALPALLGLLPEAPRADEVTLLHRLGATSMVGDRTLYSGVTRLGAAHLLELSPGGWQRRRYWSPVYRPPQAGSRTELRARLYEGVARAIRRRVEPGTRAGIMLSGGIDSSSVAAVASRECEGTLRSYSFVFPDDPEMDESGRVTQLVDSLGLEGTSLHVHRGGAVRTCLDYLHTWGVPVATPAFVLERAMMERADADGVQVLLDGQGGDEVFGNAPYLLADRIRQGRVISALRLMERFPRSSDDLPRKVLVRLFALYALRGALPYRLHRRLRARGDVRRHFVDWLSTESGRRLFAHSDIWAWKRTPGPQWWANLAYLTVDGREASGQSEYMSMREHGLSVQVRSPLFDVELVETVLRLPPEHGYQRLDRSLIREAVHGLVPDGVRLSRYKSHLGPFFHGGLSGPDLPAIRALLGPRTARVRRFLDPARVDELIETPPRVGERGWMQWASAAWFASSTEAWLRTLEDASFPATFIAEHQPPSPRVDVVRDGWS